MIEFYSGTPGSGKSLHIARRIYNRLVVAKKPVICSFDLNMDYISKNGKRKTGVFVHKPLKDMSAEFFIDYARKNHVYGVEGQTLVVMDECQRIFNPRDFSRCDRRSWIDFFTYHRHFGFDFVLISQFDMLVDKQIRNCFEFDIKHRKLNNYGFTRFSPVKIFVAVSFWYCIKKKVTQEFFIYRKKYNRIYDSFGMWQEVGGASSVGEGEDVPRSGEASPELSTA